MKDTSPLDDFGSGQTGSMHRRDFLIAGFKASLFFIACDALGAPAAALKAEPGATSSLDDSLHVVSDFLTRYKLPEGNFPSSGSWKATYDVMGWGYSKQGAANRIFGRMMLTRHPAAGGGVVYEIDYGNMIYEFETLLRASLQCTSEPLPRLVGWKTHYETRVETGKVTEPPEREGNEKKTPPVFATGAAPLSLDEQGSHRNGVLEIATSLGSRKFKTDRPVLPQWVLLDALRNAKADASDPLAGIEFDLLHDLTCYRPRQSLKPVGVLQININGGQPLSLHGFVQTGFGTEPTHYWIDADGRPLLITEGLISNALTKIEAV